MAETGNVEGGSSTRHVVYEVGKGQRERERREVVESEGGSWQRGNVMTERVVRVAMGVRKKKWNVETGQVLVGSGKSARDLRSTVTRLKFC
jgi:hypothetical protein